MGSWSTAARLDQEGIYPVKRQGHFNLLLSQSVVPCRNDRYVDTRGSGSVNRQGWGHEGLSRMLVSYVARVKPEYPSVDVDPHERRSTRVVGILDEKLGRRLWTHGV